MITDHEKRPDIDNNEADEVSRAVGVTLYLLIAISLALVAMFALLSSL